MAADVTVPPAAGPAPARWALLAGLAALVVTGSAAVLGVLTVPGPARGVTAWGGAASVAAVTAAVAVAAYCADTARGWRRRAAAAEEAAGGLHQQAAELAERTLPAMAQRLRAGVPAATVLAEVTHPADATLRRLLLAVTRDLEEARHRAAAAMSAAAAAAARMQAGTTRILADLRDLENRHADGPVFGDLLDLDHQVSQAGRLADSVALLCGGRSGRRWTRPIVVESILRGAAGRIDGYRRVRLRAATTLAVSGRAAEGIMHALAELMDNATRFSAAGSEVHVSVQEAEAGLLILVKDGGVGLQGREHRRAEALVAGPADLSTLPGSGLGLASVGRVAARYGLTVSFRPSGQGGTTAALLIPRRLVVPAIPDPVPVPVPAEPVPAGSSP
ncbi:MAG: sensor histidine kinase [Streptosporangiales bacterium]